MHAAAGTDLRTRSALRVRGLSHSFGPDEVLIGIDLDVDAGQVVALVGPSGCGKTTLLHLCAGLLRHQEGSVDNAFASQACVFQQPRLLPWKTTLDNVALGLAAAGVARAERERRASELALRMGLVEGDLDKFPHQLSGGMQSRVALARALVLDPRLLLLDEPFSALDVGLKEELYELLLAHLAERSMAVLMITHDLMEAVRLSDTILVMAPEPGRIVARFELSRPVTLRDDDWSHRSTAQLLQHPAVRSSFGLRPRAPAGARGGAMPGVARLADRAHSDRALVDRAHSDRALVDRALADRALAERALAERALAERALAERAVSDLTYADDALVAENRDPPSATEDAPVYVPVQPAHRGGPSRC